MGSSSSKLAPETVSKLQAGTHFDKKEVNQLHCAFVKECPSGRLPKSDLLLIYRQFFPFGDPEPFVSRVIQMFRGVDGIEFEDYVLGLSVISRGRVEEKVHWAFRFCDLDADGRVQVADLRAALNCALSLIGGMFSVSSESAHARVDAIFASMDADADGWAEEGDFSRVALEDPEILQGLLLYDGAI